MMVARVVATVIWEEMYILGQAPVVLMRQVCTEIEDAWEGAW
jgi:hypothetical protein